MTFLFDLDLGVEKEGAIEYGGIDFEMSSLGTCCTQVLGAEEDLRIEKNINPNAVFLVFWGDHNE